MTIAIVNPNTDNAQNGPDKNVLPEMAGSIDWIAGDTESQPINVKGFRGLGIVDPGNLGPTGWQVHVAATMDGVYAPLDIDDFGGGALKAYGTSFVAEWRWAKIVPVGAIVTPGNTPYCLS
jgi:hypothetical protein